ncbi:MAG TPA: ABC transporter permease [Terracidiphilus sp.]|nr:ABC transporter permease [Terracidiphilus sp.]
MLTSILQDARYTLRQLRRAPGFAFTAISVLALGLGANIAVFTLLSGIFLRPLPYADSGRLVSIQLESANMPAGFYASVNYANMLQLRDALGGRMPIGGVFDSAMDSIVGPGGRVQVQQQNISASLFPMLGAQPILGRAFRAGENDPGREHVVILGEDTWRRLYNADPAVIGKPLTIKGVAYTIVGVMPRGFSFPFGEVEQIWTPQPLTAADHTSMDNDRVASGELYARLPQGMTVTQLQADLTRVQAIIAKQGTGDSIPTHLLVTGYQDQLNHEARKPLLLLYAVVFGIWALACLNITSLMLARAVARMREQAVRSALGASRIRLVQQSVIESLILSACGGVAGLLLAQASIKLLWHQIKGALPMTSAIHVDWRVVAGIVALTLVTALITGIVPALRASGRSVQSALHGVTTTASASQNRTREVLVVGQLALTLVFLVGAGLFLRTIDALRAVPLGFSQQNVLTGGVILNAGVRQLNNGSSTAPNIVHTAYMPLLDRLQAIPGVKVAALSSVLPMRAEFAVKISGELDHKKEPAGKAPVANGRLASAGLADALGIPMERGRFFNADDTPSAPVAVVINKAFADKYFPGQDPIGHIYSMGKGRFADARIVGVIGNMKQYDVTQATAPEVYFCLAQVEPGTPLYGIAGAFMQVAIRAAVPAGTLRAQFDRALHEVAPDATTTGVKTMHEAVEDSFGSETLTAHLLEGFAALALMIASVGLYGLLSFAVAQRTREIGLRIALGAPLQSILTLVLRRAFILVACGLTLGATLAWFAVRLARGYIFGVQVHDALTFAIVVAVLAAASFLAAWLPARRAAAVDPMRALRSE